MSDLQLQCECGKVTGRITSPSPQLGNRIVCYCKDCQAFPVHLAKAEQTLDEAGGTEIFQIPPQNLKIDSGAEHLACLQLRENGLIRWYTSCCNTPLGNTVGPGLPFIGVIHNIVKAGQDQDTLIGPVLGNVNRGGATRDIPNSKHRDNKELPIFLRMVRKLLWWKLSGKGTPNVLFPGGKPCCKPEVVAPKS